MMIPQCASGSVPLVCPPMPPKYDAAGQLAPVWARMTREERAVANGYQRIPLATWAASARCPVDYSQRIVTDAVTGVYHAYYPLAGVARLVRQPLHETFPGVRFSVTSHPTRRGDRHVGAILVRWQDGPHSPSEAAVERCVTARYVGVTRDPATGAYSERLSLLDGYQCHLGALAITLQRTPEAKGAKSAKGGRA
jgi:Large polyvalent protein associated domain 29